MSGAIGEVGRNGELLQPEKEVVAQDERPPGREGLGRTEPPLSSQKDSGAKVRVLNFFSGSGLLASEISLEIF